MSTGKTQSTGKIQGTGETQSVNDIRTAIRELGKRAELARKEGRTTDATELERRISGYREELGERP